MGGGGRLVGGHLWDKVRIDAEARKDGVHVCARLQRWNRRGERQLGRCSGGLIALCRCGRRRGRQVCFAGGGAAAAAADRRRWSRVDGVHMPLEGRRPRTVRLAIVLVPIVSQRGALSAGSVIGLKIEGGPEVELGCEVGKMMGSEEVCLGARGCCC